MVQQLRQYGIQAVLTRPEDLSVNTVNKYLELKSRGLI
jgi:N-acetylmuramoyl-L-alanine amidase